MSSQFSNSLAISNIGMLTAHLKNSNQLNSQLTISTTPPPPLLKSTLLNKNLNLLNLSQQLLQRTNNNHLSGSKARWDQFNDYDLDSPPSSSSSSYLMNSYYLNQLLTQRKATSQLDSTLKLIDYNQQSLNNLLNQQNNQSPKLSQLLNNKSQESDEDEQDLALDLSKPKSNQPAYKNDIRSIKQLSSSLSNTTSKLTKLSDEIKRPSSLPQPKSHLNQKSSQQTISKKKSNNNSSSSSSAKKASRKVPFDEFKSSPVSGTFILTDNDVALTEFCRNGDIDPNYNRVQITAETRAELEKIENHIGDYACRLCKLCFDDAFGLAQHCCSRIVHIEYKCPDCDKEFNCPANLASHRRWHRPSSKQPGTNNKGNNTNSLNNSTSSTSSITTASTTTTTPSNNTGKVPKLVIDLNKKTITQIEKHLSASLSNSNGSGKLASLLSSSRSSTPSSPKEKAEQPIMQQQKMNIKVNDQIVSVSVCKEGEQQTTNNKVKVTKTAILPEANDEDKELMMKEQSTSKKETTVKEDQAREESNDKLVEQNATVTNTISTSTSNQATSEDDQQQVVSTATGAQENNAGYCPKKFRRQQYLNKSPRSENQENEMMNFNITDDSMSEQQQLQQDCQSLNNSCNSTASSKTHQLIKESTLATAIASSTNSNTNSNNSTTLVNNTPRKKRARSSVTNDEQNSQLRMEEADCSIDEQVFSDQNSNASSSVSFESQKKFLILKKLKSEQN